MLGGGDKPRLEDAGRHKRLGEVLPTQGVMKCPAEERDPWPSQAGGRTVLPGPQRVKTHLSVGAVVWVPAHLPPKFLWPARFGAVAGPWEGTARPGPKQDTSCRWTLSPDHLPSCKKT